MLHCWVKGCDKFVGDAKVCKTYNACYTHSRQLKQGEELEKKPVCAFEGCDRRVESDAVDTCDHCNLELPFEERQKIEEQKEDHETFKRYLEKLRELRELEEKVININKKRMARGEKSFGIEETGTGKTKKQKTN